MKDEIDDKLSPSEEGIVEDFCDKTNDLLKSLGFSIEIKVDN